MPVSTPAALAAVLAALATAVVDEPAASWRTGPVPAAIEPPPRPAAAGTLWPGAPPLERAPVERGFAPGPHRWSPGHRGVDLAGAAGVPVLAAAEGVVTFAEQLAGRGVVVVLHPDGLRTTYEPIVPAVSRGRRVQRGERLGTLAAAPTHCPSPCLHWGALRGDVYVDPLSLLRLRLRPILLPLPLQTDR